MHARRRHQAMLWILLLACGCSSTGGQLGTLQTQNRSLLEQNKAQLGEMENLKTHARRLEDKLIDAERRLAAQERGDNERQRVAAKEQESSSVFDRTRSEDGDGETSASAGRDGRR